MVSTPGKDPVPIVQEAGWAPGPVWTGAENLAPAGNRFPEPPARSESLYRLSYPGPVAIVVFLIIVSVALHPNSGLGPLKKLDTHTHLVGLL